MTLHLTHCVIGLSATSNLNAIRSGDMFEAGLGSAEAVPLDP